MSLNGIPKDFRGKGKPNAPEGKKPTIKPKRKHNKLKPSTRGFAQ